MPDTFSLRQMTLLEQLAILPTTEERLMWLTQADGTAWLLPETERTAELLVPGCVSQVWLACSGGNGDHCRFRFAADSVLVAGLVLAQVKLVDGLEAQEFAAAEFYWISSSGLDRQLSPTRLRGLGNVAAAIKRLGAERVAGRRDGFYPLPI